MFSPPLYRKPITHGTLSGYRYHRCRCLLCRKAQAESLADLRARYIRNQRCLRCGRESRPHMVCCATCAIKDSQRSMASYYRRKQQRTEAAA